MATKQQVCRWVEREFSSDRAVIEFLAEDAIQRIANGTTEDIPAVVEQIELIRDLAAGRVTLEARLVNAG